MIIKILGSGCKNCTNLAENTKIALMDAGMTADLVKVEDFQEIMKYGSYFKFSKGGVTVSGGEPLLQTQFIAALFKLCKEKSIHTAIDTSGFIFNDQVKALMSLTDLVILDIKNFDPVLYEKITGVNLKPTLNFLDYLREIGKKVWIRYVLVPDLTDNETSIETLSRFLSEYQNIEKIEVLPFHKMGEYKWRALSIPYTLDLVNEPTQEQKNRVSNLFQKWNKHVEVT